MTSEHLECDGNYGLPVVDTHDGFFRVYYFDIAQVVCCCCCCSTWDEFIIVGLLHNCFPIFIYLK